MNPARAQGRTEQSGAEQATTRKRGQRGAGRRARRAIQRVAEERQGVWLGRTRDGRTDTSELPVRIRVADLTGELEDLYDEKRETRRSGGAR